MQWCLIINLIGFCVGGLFALTLFKSHNLDQVLDGDLDPLFDALAAADKQARLQST